jgi:hypothetical protein
MNNMRFKRRGEYTIEEAVLIAYNTVFEVFYLNAITRIVRNMMRPLTPYDSSISRKLRCLMAKGKVKYVANNDGIYTKLEMPE